MASKNRKNIVVLGGGTGTFTVLSGLKAYPADLTAIVTMSDDGGSTGVLRDELGVLPPGDVRQCLVALSTSDELMRSLMNYRFEEGGLKGHNFGNLLLSALEKITGDFDSAVEKASEVLSIKGRVIPSTLDKVKLAAKVGGKTVIGENVIHKTKLNGDLEKMWLEPRGRANPKALEAVKNADVIVIGPGDLFSSLIPNLLVKGLPEAIRTSKAKKVLVCNLMSYIKHSKNFSVANFTATLEKYLGGEFDIVIYNSKAPSPKLIERYAREGETLTRLDLPEDRELIGEDLVATSGLPKRMKHDKIVRSLVRHDPAKIAAVIARIAKIKIIK